MGKQSGYPYSQNHFKQCKEGEPLTLHAEDNKIVIEPATKRKNIKELFEGYDGNYETKEVDWGEPVGKEVW